MNINWERKNLSSVPISIGLILGLLLISNARAKSARDIAEKTFPSVVMLVMQDSHGQPISLGSGFFVNEDIVATNLHVIEGAASGYVKIVGKKPKYDVAGFVVIDRQRDLVLLKVQNVKAQTLVLADSNNIAVGDEVYAIGNPQGLEGTFSKGIVSGIRKVGEDKIMQITAPISPGSSGGPVLNTQGEVIGVSVATFKGGQNLNFAIPASYLSILLPNMKSATELPVSEKSKKRRKSILDKLGTRNTEGVIGAEFTWRFNSELNGEFTFTLRNNLRHSVQDVYCLVIIYDKDHKPLDISVSRCRETIPPGLGRRTKGSFDDTVKRLTTPKDKRYLSLYTSLLQKLNLEYWISIL